MVYDKPTMELINQQTWGYGRYINLVNGSYKPKKHFTGGHPLWKAMFVTHHIGPFGAMLDYHTPSNSRSVLKRPKVSKIFVLFNNFDIP